MFFTLILENANGDQVDMTATANRYMTSKIEGLSPPPGTISTSSYAGMDGSYLNNAFIEKRNVVISFEMRGVGVEARRHQLYKVVKPSRYIKVYNKTAGIDVFTEGYVETCEVSNFEMFTTGQISILCPDIYWYANETQTAEYSLVLGAFHFICPDDDKPFPIGQYNTENMMTIVNDGDDTGMTLVISGGPATKLTANDWYDYREDENVCGYCKCILGKCRFTELMAQTAQLMAEVQKNNQTIDSLKNQVETLQTAVDDTIGGIAEMGTCGENVQYVLYSNGKLLLHGTGATFDYDIGKSPFFENENIKSLIVSDGITTIGKSVFERCSNMTSVIFPNTLTEIGERAFFMYDIGGLTELTIPASVTTIGEKAFVNLNAETVTLPVTLTSLGSNLFMDAKALVSARVECEVVPSFCFVNSSLHTLTLSHNVKKIGAHMINYTPLTEITYEGSLADWAAVTKESSWDGNHIANGLMHKVVCLDGYMEYNADTKEWTEVKT